MNCYRSSYEHGSQYDPVIKYESPMKLFCDKFVINIAHNLV